MGVFIQFSSTVRVQSKGWWSLYGLSDNAIIVAPCAMYKDIVRSLVGFTAAVVELLLLLLTVVPMGTPFAVERFLKES
jgi:hypothetical protein